jgi:thiamine pyrophosphokinase
MRAIPYPIGMEVVIFAGGDAPKHVGPLPEDAFVIAADAGYDVARRAGVSVDLLIGDLDSVSAVPDDVTTVRFPVDKDETDLDLAIRHSRSLGSTSILVIGGSGGRIDHFLANAALLAAQDGVGVEWRTGSGTAFRVNGVLSLDGSPGEIVSLLAFGGTARGVRTMGLRWRLDGEDLLPGSTRGVSNAFERASAVVSLDEGNLLVILPER